ncbi:MAG: hypothetical protein ACI9HA_002924, partial [Dinoroseobacter sp.]
MGIVHNLILQFCTDRRFFAALEPMMKPLFLMFAIFA